MSYFPPQSPPLWSPPSASPPPKRPNSNSGAIVTAVIAVLVVVGGGITAAIVWASHRNSKPAAPQVISTTTTAATAITLSPSASVEQALRTYIKTLNAQSTTGATVRVCAQYRDQWSQADLNQGANTTTLIDSVENVSVTGLDATVKYTVHQNVTGQPPGKAHHRTLTMHSDNGGWLPCMPHTPVHH